MNNGVFLMHRVWEFILMICILPFWFTPFSNCSTVNNFFNIRRYSVTNHIQQSTVFIFKMKNMLFFYFHPHTIVVASLREPTSHFSCIYKLKYLTLYKWTHCLMRSTKSGQLILVEHSFLKPYKKAYITILCNVVNIQNLLRFTVFSFVFITHNI